MNDLSRQQEYLLLGLDVGSTTVKAAVVKPDEPKPLFVRYRRHHAEQMHAIRLLLEEVREAFPQAAFRIAVCGSGRQADCRLYGYPFCTGSCCQCICGAAFVSADAHGD